MRQFAAVVIFGLILAVIVDAGFFDRRITLLTLSDVQQTSDGLQHVFQRAADGVSYRVLLLWRRYVDAA
jgi:hypothetical protein